MSFLGMLFLTLAFLYGVRVFVDNWTTLWIRVGWERRGGLKQWLLFKHISLFLPVISPDELPVIQFSVNIVECQTSGWWLDLPSDAACAVVGYILVNAGIAQLCIEFRNWCSLYIPWGRTVTIVLITCFFLFQTQSGWTQLSSPTLHLIAVSTEWPQRG